MAYLNQHLKKENFMEVLTYNHKRYRPIVEVLDNIVKSAKELNWLDFEEIAIAVSKENCSSFCSEIHRGTKDALKQSNITTSTNIDTMIEFSLKLNKNPNEITNDDIQVIRDMGWNDQSIEDVVAWVASINLYNTMAVGLGFSDKLPSEAFDEMGSGTISHGGFLSIFDFFVSQN